MHDVDFGSYDYIIVAFSGGKDSTACVLDLLDQGCPKEKIELWHHDIDGREGNDLMDWPITRDYCRAFADAFGLPLYYSWKMGGFEREMLRNEQRTAPIKFKCPDGFCGQCGGTRGKPGTRMKFPQISPDLSVRYCSAYLKIDVGAAAIRNQERFTGKRTIFITGERAQESSARAKYNTFEPDRSDNRNGKRVMRLVDHYRPVHSWMEERVWEAIERHKIRAHPAYYLGWGRVSCAACIFGSKDQWASLYQINPQQVQRIIDYEEQFGVTIKRKDAVADIIKAGTPYPDMDPEIVNLALGNTFNKSIIVDGDWTLPNGAFGDSAGPS
jgi:3'-phosphoadenosine 5'-phosphosulfate sulfotransferase (PAPS reductase)/FAD synthetase